MSVPHPARPLVPHVLTGLGTVGPHNACRSTRGPASGARVQHGRLESGRPSRQSRPPFLEGWFAWTGRGGIEEQEGRGATTSGRPEEREGWGEDARDLGRPGLQV